MPIIFFYYKLQIGLSVSVYENVAVKAEVCNTMSELSAKVYHFYSDIYRTHNHCQTKQSFTSVHCLCFFTVALKFPFAGGKYTLSLLELAARG